MLSGDVRRAIGVGAVITVGAILAAFVPVFLWVWIDPVVQISHILISAIVLPAVITPACCFFILRAKLRAERLARENDRIAHTDELTGLPNRRAFFNAARLMQLRAKTNGRQLVCAIADVDNFKQVNDRHGHKSGDCVLIDIALTLNSSAPNDCVVARLGGEEFALIALFEPGTDIQRELECMVASVAGRAVPLCAETALDVTISLGYCLDPEEDEISALLSRADKMLYRAKQSGKNQAIGETVRRKSVSQTPHLRALAPHPVTERPPLRGLLAS